MQLMSWTIARLGSRFMLHFEPYQRRVLHSALGRFLDQPLDLMVGLIDPDGAERVFPFTNRGKLLYNCEQFERINSITFRGFDEKHHLQLELNFHSVFYPQNMALCTMPAFYMELRLYPAGVIRRQAPSDRTPNRTRLFVRLDRPDTQISASAADGGRLDLQYNVALTPPPKPEVGLDQQVAVYERLQSRNDGAVPDPDGKGLSLELPVTEPDAGVKWRLVWGAYCGDPVMEVNNGQGVKPARLKYAARLHNIDQVMNEAIEQRDDRLNHSRRYEKLFDQIPLQTADKHLINHCFQNFLGNTFWCDLDKPQYTPGDAAPMDADDIERDEWFSVWTGVRLYHGAIDVEYNHALFYLTLWPKLLAMQFAQWAVHEKRHEPSDGGYMSHDVGRGMRLTGVFYDHEMPVEESSDFLLLLQAYSRWTGDLTPARRLSDLIERLARYLLWTDRDDCGFPSEGTPNTLADAAPAMQYARKQTYLAVKRLAALRAAADLLGFLDRHELARRCDEAVDRDRSRIHQQAWLGDHYAVCIDKSTLGVKDATTGEPMPYDELPGWDAYSIYTSNGLLLPTMIGQPPQQNLDELIADLINARRETLGRYGCGHTSAELNNVRISQNLWRDHLARYLGSTGIGSTQRYWDLQVAVNTGESSLGYTDTYINNNHTFFPRGVVALGFLMSCPRLTIDKLAPGGARISVDPDRHYYQRWPLLALADWKAGRIPICVVDHHGAVKIEGAVEPIIVRGQNTEETQLIG